MLKATETKSMETIMTSTVKEIYWLEIPMVLKETIIEFKVTEIMLTEILTVFGDAKMELKAATTLYKEETTILMVEETKFWDTKMM